MAYTSLRGLVRHVNKLFYRGHVYAKFVGAAERVRIRSIRTSKGKLQARTFVSKWTEIEPDSLTSD